MNNVILCDNCQKEFSLTPSDFSAIEDGDLRVEFFICPHCRSKHLYFASDTKMRELVQERRRIADMIRAGQVKGFKPKTLRRYIQMMDKVKAKQMEVYPGLKERGERLLKEHREDLKEEAGATLT